MNLFEPQLFVVPAFHTIDKAVFADANFQLMSVKNIAADIRRADVAKSLEQVETARRTQNLKGLSDWQIACVRNYPNRCTRYVDWGVKSPGSTLEEILEKNQIPRSDWTAFRIDDTGKVTFDVLSDVDFGSFGSVGSNYVNSAYDISEAFQGYIKAGGKTDAKSIKEFMTRLSELIYKDTHNADPNLIPYANLSTVESQQAAEILKSGVKSLFDSQISFLEKQAAGTTEFISKGAILLRIRALKDAKKSAEVLNSAPAAGLAE